MCSATCFDTNGFSAAEPRSQPEDVLGVRSVGRPGLYQCNACKEPFTVTVGTLYERSHVPLHKWLATTHLMMTSKKGMSALQISRMIDVTYKTAWFMCHRIRESLRETSPAPLGGVNKVVEADETYAGGKRPTSA